MKTSSTSWLVLMVATLGNLWINWRGDTVAQAQAPAAATAADQREFFENQVRPLLATHCYACHSLQAEKLKAGLRVDSRTAALRGGDSGPAVVPGHPQDSLLMSAVRYEAFEMPPQGKLSDAEITTLEQWIQRGAWWPPEATEVTSAGLPDDFDWQARKASHWAWQPLASASPPDTPGCDWGTSALDQFIIARLRESHLQPAPPADPQRLVRRLYLDVIGLPPTPEQVQAFVADPGVGSYQRLVDQLLESPQFGEKWARHWLDLVRYAETCGHEFDYPIPHAYRYRDYLIRALNEDVPYDQLVREHIAGDLISAPRQNRETGTNESILGTGFWFLGEAVHAPTDVRGDEADRINNQIDVFGKAFLGMTLACARCHDHKFDPIPTSDYYALAGFLQSSRRQEALLDPRHQIEQQAARIAACRADGDRLLAASTSPRRRPAVGQFAEYLLAAQNRLSGGGAAADLTHAVPLDEPLLDRFVAALRDDDLQSADHPLHAWRVLSSAATESTFAEHRAQLDAELSSQQQAYQAALERMIPFADFRAGNYDDWFVTGWAFGSRPTIGAQWDGPDTETRFARPYVAHSGRLGRPQVGVLRSQTFTLEHEYVHYRMRGDNVQLRLIIDGYVMDVYSALLFADATLENVNTDGRYRWVSQHQDLDHYQGHRAHLEVIDHGAGYAAVEGIYFSDTGPPPEAVHGLNLQLVADSSLSGPADLAAAYARELQAAPAGDGALRWVELWNWLLKWRLIEPGEPWPALAKEVERLEKSVPAPLLATAIADGTGEDERVHIRGSHRNLGESVPRRLPVALATEPPLSIERGSGRRELAERLTSRDNPLLARVVVNRLWHHLMGRGIVATVDDFGAMGQAPTHPLLLDWLARDLMDHGWSLKRTIREIVTSQVYQQSSQPQDPAAATADPDNQLWHRHLVKRLTAEAIRDSMLAISGQLNPTVFGPSVPVHLTAFMTGRGRPESGPLDSAGRRSIYVRVQRNFLSPMMLAFDMPAPFSTMGRRSVSNVPAQSLILMNDEFIWQQAEHWAQRLLREAETDESRVERLFLQAFARPPSDDERTKIARFIEHQSSLHGSPADALRVWTDVCHAMWNAKEFLYLF